MKLAVTLHAANRMDRPWRSRVQMDMLCLDWLNQSVKDGPLCSLQDGQRNRGC